MTPLLSVIVPNYNYGRFLPQTLQSIFDQTFQDFEVLVIDNGSTDDSLEVLKGCRERFGERLRVVAQENRGQAGSRNRGIAESHGELLAFLDADDIWLPTKLEKQLPYFRDPEVGLVYSGYVTTDIQLKALKTVPVDKRGWLLADFAVGASSPIAAGESTAVIRRRCFIEAGLFDPELSISCGWDMFRRIASRFRIECASEPLVYYRQHGSNAHLKVDVYEHDVLLRTRKMYEDPASSKVHPLRRRTYGKMYLTLSGSYRKTGKLVPALKYLAKGLLTWPPALFELGTIPWLTVIYISYDGLMEPLGQSQVYQPLKELARRTPHRYFLITYEKKRDWEDVERRREVEKQAREAGLHWIPLRYHKRPSLPATFYDAFKGTLVAGWLAIRYRGDIVHARSYVAALPALALKSVLGTRFLFDMRGFWPDERVDAGSWGKSSLKYRLAKRFERVFLTRADAIVSLTAAGVEEMKKFSYLKDLQPRFRVIPTCANLELFKPVDPKPGRRPFTVGYAGTATGWYLFEPFVQCFKLIQKRVPDARLLILNRDEQPYIEELLRRHRIDESLVELRSVPHPRMPIEMSRMDVSVFFIKPTFSKKASAPTKLAELLGCGIPCLTNAGVGDLGTILQAENVGAVVPNWEPTSLEDGVNRLMSLCREPDIRSRCVETSRKYFSLDSGVTAYRQLYEVLSERAIGGDETEPENERHGESRREVLGSQGYGNLSADEHQTPA